MGLFKKRSTDPSETGRLKEQIASMAERLDATDAAKHQLGVQVAGIVTRLDTPLEPPPVTAPPPPSVTPDEFQALVSRVTDLGQRFSAEPEAVVAVNAQVQRITERIDQLDARITSISTELANQITELSGELDGRGGEPATEVVGQLREAQVKLANEQARYQIAFRQDLANLADFLKPH